MNRFQLTLVTLISLFSSPQLFAHSGHGSTEAINPNGILHYLTEPIHLAPFAAIALFVLLLVIGRKYRQRSREQRQLVVIPRNKNQN
ncbi:MAG: hypothetical protein K0U86_23215 [Planctomycetes bacterium]|nr:hypothetical protein [Planctomycetota bacterium]MCH9727822.1 hypothetical protein [Planctomycetota bacterium]MCH9779385.1 hypothetical protein [Planctomycetota bacterium]MCH9792754.1 hypothetical protein [Planctomycetota bacterium]MDF1745425.1 hypothetical protein [Gimesia sp.]